MSTRNPFMEYEMWLVERITEQGLISYGEKQPTNIHIFKFIYITNYHN